jgi:hypothetical protein
MFRKFLDALYDDWMALVSGIASVILAVWVVLFSPSSATGRKALWASFVICLFIAAYRIWSKERSRFEELKSRHETQVLVFEIDEALTRIRIHDESPTVVRVTADVGLYFVSKDTNDWALKRLDVSLHRLIPGGPVKIYGYHFMRYRHVSGAPIDTAQFERMVIQRGTKTETYIASGIISLGEEIKAVSDLGSLCFLRVTMEATSNQPPLNADLFFTWEGALNPDGIRPTLIAGVDTINKITDTRIG